jgi:hypothetical protein
MIVMMITMIVSIDVVAVSSVLSCAQLSERELERGGILGPTGQDSEKKIRHPISSTSLVLFYVDPLVPLTSAFFRTPAPRLPSPAPSPPRPPYVPFTW